MAKNSNRGISHESEVYKLTRQIASNASYISKEDLKVLKHLATRGDYPDKKAILKDNNSVPFVDEVETFNATFGKPNNYEPTIPEEKEWKFVYNFILEELEEYREACQNGDIVEVLDALCDITYVSLANGVLLHGLKDKIQKAYNEVQASNMSKACKSEEIAKKTSEYRSKQLGVETYYEKVGNVWVVYRKSDKKVLKSLDFFPPNLHQFFTEDEIKNCKK